MIAKRYEKGETIKYKKRDESEAEYPNKVGSHGIINHSGKLVQLNRRQFRQRSPFRGASKKGYKSHIVNEPKFERTIDSSLSNHARHLERRAQRSKARGLQPISL